MNPHKMKVHRSLTGHWVALCHDCTVRHSVNTFEWAIRCVISHQNLRGAYQVHDTSTKEER